jgi:hypothetical protein
MLRLRYRPVLSVNLVITAYQRVSKNGSGQEVFLHLHWSVRLFLWPELTLLPLRRRSRCLDRRHHTGASPVSSVHGGKSSQEDGLFAPLTHHATVR